MSGEDSSTREQVGTMKSFQSMLVLSPFRNLLPEPLCMIYLKILMTFGDLSAKILKGVRGLGGSRGTLGRSGRFGVAREVAIEGVLNGDMGLRRVTQ